MMRCPKEHSPAVFFGRLYDKDTAIATMLPILKALRQSTDLLFEDKVDGYITSLSRTQQKHVPILHLP